MPLHAKRAAEMLALYDFIRKSHGHTFPGIQIQPLLPLCPRTSPSPSSETMSHDAAESVKGKDPTAWSVTKRLNKHHMTAAWKTHVLGG